MISIFEKIFGKRLSLAGWIPVTGGAVTPLWFSCLEKNASKSRQPLGKGVFCAVLELSDEGCEFTLLRRTAPGGVLLRDFSVADSLGERSSKNIFLEKGWKN